MSCTPPTTAYADRRQQLRLHGYLPLPLFGKAPPLKEWQKFTAISRDMIDLWGKIWPDAVNTGCLTRWMPALDLDIINEEAARYIESLIDEHFSEMGYVLVRIGKPPKRAIIFRTNDPFKKVVANLVAPNGNAEKIEFLGDGQQLVVDGIHPETKQPYRWHGGVPWDIPHAELPYIHPHEAAEWVDKIAQILVTQFNYQRVQSTKNNGGTLCHGTTKPTGEDHWRELIDNVHYGRALHDTFRDLAAMLAASGMSSGAATHLLQALGERVEPYDARVETRLRDIPRAIDTAYRKFR